MEGVRERLPWVDRGVAQARQPQREERPERRPRRSAHVRVDLVGAREVHLRALGRLASRGVALLRGQLGLVGAAQVRLGLLALAVGFHAQPLGRGTLLLGRALHPEEEHAVAEHYGRQSDRLHGTEADGTMLRSEEELRVEHAEMRPAELVRLKKVLVTEHVEQTVPRRREVIQFETEPPPAGTIESVEDLGDAPR